MTSRYGSSKKRADNWLILVLLLGGLLLLKVSGDRSGQNILAIVLALAAVASIAVLVLMAMKGRRDALRLRALELADIDRMDGLAFERYVAELLRRRGYDHVRLTEKYDYGVDIIARKDGVTWGIQTKRYKKPVKAAAVRQVFTGLSSYKCDRAMVVSNSTYSRPAITLAERNNCVLIGKAELADWIRDFQTK